MIKKKSKAYGWSYKAPIPFMGENMVKYTKKIV
jgi:hypothetical protein